MERPDTLRRLCPSGLPILVRLAACRPPEEAELARCLAVGEGWLAEGRTGPESAALLLPYAADAAPARALRRFTRAENTRGGWVVVLGPMDGANLRACLRRRSFAPFRLAARELDCDTLLLLFGLFILIEGIRKAGVIDAAAQLFYTLSGDDPFRLYTLLVFVSVGLSAFIDNIPYVATMLPVVQGIAGLMNGGAGFPPELFYFGLLTGATLGGNLTPIGASANIAAIGILRKQGEQVRTRDFLRIGIPFTLAAVLTGYVYLWLVWGA